MGFNSGFKGLIRPSNTALLRILVFGPLPSCNLLWPLILAFSICVYFSLFEVSAELTKLSIFNDVWMLASGPIPNLED